MSAIIRFPSSRTTAKRTPGRQRAQGSSVVPFPKRPVSPNAEWMLYGPAGLSRGVPSTEAMIEALKSGPWLYAASIAKPDVVVRFTAAV